MIVGKSHEISRFLFKLHMLSKIVSILIILSTLNQRFSTKQGIVNAKEISTDILLYLFPTNGIRIAFLSTMPTTPFSLPYSEICPTNQFTQIKSYWSHEFTFFPRIHGETSGKPVSRAINFEAGVTTPVYTHIYRR